MWKEVIRFLKVRDDMFAVLVPRLGLGYNGLLLCEENCSPEKQIPVKEEDMSRLILLTYFIMRNFKDISISLGGGRINASL